MNLRKLFGQAAGKMDMQLQDDIRRLPDNTDLERHLFDVLITASKLPFADAERIREIFPGRIYSARELSLNELKQLAKDQSVTSIEKERTAGAEPV